MRTTPRIGAARPSPPGGILPAMRWSGLLSSFVLLAALCGCGQRPTDAREAPAEAEGTGLPLMTVRLSLAPSITLPERGAISVLGYAPEHLAGAWPVPGARPGFFWTTGGRTLTFPVALDVPLPTGLSLFVTVDADGNGVPGPGDQMAAPLLRWVRPDDKAPIELLIDRAFDPSVGRDVGQGRPGDGGEGDRPLGMLSEGAPGDETLPRTQGGAPDPDERQVRLRIVGSKGLNLPMSAAIFVLGYPPDSLGASGPRPGLLPGAFFPVAAQRLDFPIEVVATVRDGYDLLVLVDADGSGTPGPGDVIARPIPRFHAPAGSEAATDIALVGPFEAGSPNANTQQAPNGVRIDSAGRVSPGGGTPVRLGLRFSAGMDAEPGVAFFVLGYEPTSLDAGLPKPGSRPRWFFQGALPTGKGTRTVQAQQVAELQTLVLVDGDGDGSPGPGDLVGTLGAAGNDGTVPVNIDRRFATTAPALPTAEALGRASSGAERTGPKNEGPKRSLVLSLAPALAAPKSAGLFILGYPQGTVDRGLPRPGVRPLFAWQSPPLQPTFPIRLDAPLPEGGLTLLVVLDGDGSNEPGPGDLMAEPVEGFLVPPQGQPLALVLDRSFAPAQPVQAPPGAESRGETDESLLPAWLRKAP